MGTCVAGAKKNVDYHHLPVTCVVGAETNVSYHHLPVTCVVGAKKMWITTTSPSHVSWVPKQNCVLPPPPRHMCRGCRNKTVSYHHLPVTCVVGDETKLCLTTTSPSHVSWVPKKNCVLPPPPRHMCSGCRKNCVL